MNSIPKQILRYIAAIVISIPLFSAVPAMGQNKIKLETPKLVVMITVDQLRSDFLHEFEGLYTDNGIKRLMNGGRYYSNGYYAFESIDRASAVATLTTGTNP